LSAVHGLENLVDVSALARLLSGRAH
jgi:hypothetical protein